jgi:hypothetical protein
MRIGVCISRTWNDWDSILEALSDAAKGIPRTEIVLVHGASQMDLAVAGIAYMLGWKLEPWPADWRKYGKGAGPKRNQDMVNSGADIWISLNRGNSRGTEDCATRAERAGIRVKRYTRDS